MMLNRVSLNTIGLNRIGLNRIGKPSRASSDRPYIDPEVLASLKAVCICYGKSNDDPDRAVVKNLVDPDNPFVISNAAYEGMSGCNGYPVVFGSNKTWETLSSVYGYTSDVTSTTIHITRVKNAGTGLLFSYVKKDGALTNIREIPAFRVTVKGLEGNSKFGYRYLATEDATGETLVYLGNGTHELSKSFTPTEALFDLTRNAWVGIFITPMVEGEVVFDCDITIEVLPEYEGAFVTDGIDDLITSTKTVQEMGITEACTVISMIHQIDKPSNYITTNNIRTAGSVVGRNAISEIGKTGIYGWYKDNIQGSTINVINNILGDKAVYTVSASSNTTIASKFYVVGYASDDSINETSSVAWYWTIIANKVLTTDQINQVIAYFNLDRTLNPDILCNTIKQGITNENHAEFGDKLIDFSGNGRDIQLNNIAWNKDSGIGKYGMDFLEWESNNGMNFTSTKLTSTKPNLSGGWLTFRNVSGLISETKVKVSGAAREFVFIGNNNATDDKFPVTINNGVYTIPEFTLSSASGFYINNNSGDWSNLVIEQIPSHAGALCLDGVNDFGKVTGMPIYKDYTVVADYERFYLEPITGGRASILSKSSKVGDGSFIFNLESQDGDKACYTFGEANGNISDDITRIIRYQSKYYNTKTLSIGTAEDNDFMVLGKVREVDNRYFYGAIYSLMSFPYSMSEFLIERQLKKHKLGTLYPDMVEFRPIVKSNLPYSSISYSVNPGEYISVDSMVTITVTLPNTSDKLMEVSCNAISDISISGDNGVYEIAGKIFKSPQKINMIISSYLTMLSNSTLISNETLIKNE